MPTAPITPAAVVAAIPDVYVAPERIAYAAAIGIPISADAPRRDAYIPAGLGPAARAEAVAYSEQAVEPARTLTTKFYATNRLGEIIGEPGGYPSLAAVRTAERLIGR